MNFLAHALLAGGDAELEVGGVLADFVHGRPDPALPPGLRRGIVLHRAIDRFTDTHPQVVAARAAFAPPWRRYAGIMLDVWFDHCLALDFERWSACPLQLFSDRLQRRLRADAELFPPRLLAFMRWMREHNVPAGYADADVVDEALKGLSGRLSHRNPLDRALPLLERHQAELDATFAAFFPDLVAFADRWRITHAVPA